MTESELQALIDDGLAKVRSGAMSLEEHTKRVADASKTLEGSLGKLGTTVSTAGTQIYGGVESFTKSMANGAQGASAFGGLITGAAGALGTFSEVLGKLGPVGNALGEALGGVTKFSAEYVVRSLKQSDDLFNSWQGLSKVGGASAEGMKGVFDNMQKLGMSMNELPQFGALIAKNSEALAVMGGTVAEGTKKFATVASGIEQSGLQTQFERMGISVQAQNEGIANYLKLQTMTSAGAVKSQEALTAGAAAYLEQQDRLSRLTGKSADALAKEAEARQANERYAAVTLELQMKADELRAAGDEAGAKAAEDQMKQNEELLSRTPAALKQGVQDLMSGVVNSPEAQKMYIAMPEMSQKIMSQQFKASETLAAGAKEADAYTKRNIGLAKAGLSDKSQASFSGSRALAQLKVEEGDKTAKKEITGLKEGDNVDINNQVAMRDAQRSTTIAMDNLTNQGVTPLTGAMAKAATTINTAISTLPKEIIGEKTALTRKPTEEDLKANSKATEQSLARGRESLPEEKYKTTLPDAKALAGYWETFLKNVMLATEETPDVKEKKTEVSKDQKGRIKPLSPLSSPVSSPSPAPAGAPRADFRRMPGLGDRGAGPAYRAPGVLEDNRPENQTSTKTAAADSGTELAGVISEGIRVLSRGQAEQQQTMSELVDLMRRSVGVQGKILQTSR